MNPLKREYFDIYTAFLFSIHLKNKKLTFPFTLGVAEPHVYTAWLFRTDWQGRSKVSAPHVWSGPFELSAHPQSVGGEGGGGRSELQY